MAGAAPIANRPVPRRPAPALPQPGAAANLPPGVGARFQCSLCFDAAPAPPALRCGDLLCCVTCLDAHVMAKSQGPGDGEAGLRSVDQLGYVECPCGNAAACPAPALSLQRVSASVTESTFEAAVAARDRHRERAVRESLARSHSRDLKRQLEDLEAALAATKTGGDGAAEAAAARRVSSARHASHVLQVLLVTRCPNQHAFFDFEGCFSLACATCGIRFCAYCLGCPTTNYGESHAHVAACPENSPPHGTPGSYYGDVASFYAHHRSRIESTVRRYLQSIVDPGVRRLTAIAVMPHLRGRAGGDIDLGTALCALADGPEPMTRFGDAEAVASTAVTVGPSGAVSPPSAFDVTLSPGDPLQSSFDGLVDGASVWLNPGVYRGPLVLKRPVHVFGAGPASVSLEFSGTDSSLSSTASTATVDGVAIRQAGGAGRGVVVASGALRLQNCTVSSMGGDAVLVTGADAAPTLVGCRLTDSAGAGLHAEEGATPTVMDCVLAGNKGAGVSVEEGAVARLERCDLATNAESGAYFGEGGGGTLSGCTLHHNGGSGVHVACGLGGDPTVKACVIKHNAEYGLFTDSDSSLKAELDSTTTLRGNTKGNVHRSPPDALSAGASVVLATGWRDHSDAGGGPLCPGVMGTIAQSGARRCLVSHGGVQWWYDRPALCAPGSAEADPAGAAQAGVKQAGVDQAGGDHAAFAVGTRVCLAAGFRACGDAGEGPLAAGDVATVEAVGLRTRVRGWYYDREALVQEGDLGAAPARTGRETLAVGDAVVLSIGWEGRGNAVGGGMRPGVVGTVVAVNDGHIRVEGGGRGWWYSRENLTAPGAPDAAPVPAEGGGGALARVGSRVVLARGYQSITDAADGPLSPGEVGIIVTADDDDGPLEIQAGGGQGGNWWYQREALTAPDSDDAADADAAPKAAPFAVGDAVVLARGYTGQGDASAGPLVPGMVGQIVGVDESMMPAHVEAGGRRHWYRRDALTMPGADDESSWDVVLGGMVEGREGDTMWPRYFAPGWKGRVVDGGDGDGDDGEGAVNQNSFPVRAVARRPGDGRGPDAVFDVFLSKANVRPASAEDVDTGHGGGVDEGDALESKAAKIRAVATGGGQHANLCGSGLTEDDAGDVAAAVYANEGVTVLDLDRNALGDAGAAVIAEVVRSAPTLDQLYLESNGLTDAGGSLVAAAAAGHPALTILWLSGASRTVDYNRLGDATATALVAMLVSTPQIAQLHLGGNAFSATARDAVRAAWGDRGDGLQL